MIRHRKLLRKSTLIILFGVAVIAMLTVLVVEQSPSIKDRYQVAPLTEDDLVRDLAAFKQLPESREYTPLLSPIASGDKLSFKVSVLRPTFVGMLVSINQQKPSLVFYTRLPPGENRRLERQGNRYVFSVTEAVKTLKFCVIYAVDKKALQNQIGRIGVIWPNIPESSCLTLR